MTNKSIQYFIIDIYRANQWCADCCGI